MKHLLFAFVLSLTSLALLASYGRESESTYDIMMQEEASKTAAKKQELQREAERQAQEEKGWVYTDKGATVSREPSQGSAKETVSTGGEGAEQEQPVITVEKQPTEIPAKKPSSTRNEITIVSKPTTPEERIQNLIEQVTIDKITNPAIPAPERGKSWLRLLLDRAVSAFRREPQTKAMADKLNSAVTTITTAKVGSPEHTAALKQLAGLKRARLDSFGLSIEKTYKNLENTAGKLRAWRADELIPLQESLAAALKLNIGNELTNSIVNDSVQRLTEKSPTLFRYFKKVDGEVLNPYQALEVDYNATPETIKQKAIDKLSRALRRRGKDGNPQFLPEDAEAALSAKILLGMKDVNRVPKDISQLGTFVTTLEDTSIAKLATPELMAIKKAFDSIVQQAQQEAKALMFDASSLSALETKVRNTGNAAQRSLAAAAVITKSSSGGVR